MKNIATVMRRELAAYYTSPIGYIYMIVFLLITVGLYMTSFFFFPEANLRSYFSNLPIVLCVFVPAVTMRIWAEERKENTWELLLTFPMRARELVLGKFLASFVFISLTFAGTVTLPIMLAWLGDPDNGALIGGYIGMFLLGAFFLSIGIFISSLCKDQIVAFVVTLLVCFAIFLLGTEFIAGYLDAKISGLGALLTSLVAISDHFMAFTRGVVNASDVLYFLIWTGIMLLLNTMFIDGRNRPGAKATFSTAVAICLGIGLAFNWMVAGRVLGRVDLTENKIYTISEATKKILSSVDTPVQLKVYITPRDQMPTSLGNLERDISDKLQDLKLASNGKIDYTVIHLSAANVLASQRDMMNPEEKKEGEEKDDAKAIEERMLDKGIEPFPVRAIEEDAVTSKLIYAHVGVAYKNKPEEIIPQMIPDALPELEYRLVSTIYKLTREKEPVVALVAPKEAVEIEPQLRRLYEQMGQPVPTSKDPYQIIEQVLGAEKYEVRRVNLTQESKLPDEYDCLVILNPRHLNDRQRWEINRALRAGKSVILAVQQYQWDYRPSRRGMELSHMTEEPQINPLLESYGLGVDEDILMDTNHVPVNIGGNSLAALLGGAQPVDLPIQMTINNTTMNQDVSITNRLGMVTYLWGTALELDDDKLTKAGLSAVPLISTTANAWKIAPEQRLSAESFEEPGKGETYTLMAMVTGQFPDAFEGKARPAWPQEPTEPGAPPPPPVEDEPEAAPVTPQPGKLILMGCATTFQEDFLRGSPTNLDLFMNSVDALTLSDDLVHVRGQKPVDRLIAKPSESVRRLWQAVNYGLMPVIIAAIGITVMAVRRQRRNAYTMAFATAEE